MGYQPQGEWDTGTTRKMIDRALLKRSDGLWLSTVMQSVTTQLHLFSLFDLKCQVQWRDVCHRVTCVKDINWVPGEATQPAAQL